VIEKLQRFWAASVAYVALLVGAGLSVAGNVADTFRVRGALTDGLDITLAGAWPILVLLTIELFVSQRWSPRRGFQVLRWIGCLAVGSMAMLSSWVHLHDLLANRGQLIAVAVGGPLAIDGMAIMATGLLLSSRSRVATAKVIMDMATSNPAPAVAMSTSVPAPAVATDMDTCPDIVVDTTPDPILREDTWTEADDRQVEDMWSRLSTSLDSATTPPVPIIPGKPVVKAPAATNEVRPSAVPDEARAYLLAWAIADEDVRPGTGELEAILAGHFGVAPRTIRRWRYATIR